MRNDAPGVGTGMAGETRNETQLSGTYERQVSAYAAPIRFETNWTFDERSSVWEGRIDVNQQSWVIQEYLAYRFVEHDETRVQAVQRLVPVNLTVDWVSDVVYDVEDHDQMFGYLMVTGRRHMRDDDAYRWQINQRLGL